MSTSRYQGQCWGGPEHGDLWSSSVLQVMYRREVWAYLDGDKGNPSVHITAGSYVWSPAEGRFDWDGPGADGDTIERLRLQ